MLKSNKEHSSAKGTFLPVFSYTPIPVKFGTLPPILTLMTLRTTRHDVGQQHLSVYKTLLFFHSLTHRKCQYTTYLLYFKYFNIFLHDY